VLLFQRSLAEINAGRLDDAQTLLDEAAGTAGIDAVSRWQAEWNLARALQVGGQTTQALKRVARLVNEPGATAMPADLLVRMAWLQARLAFESGSPAEAIRLVDALLARLEAPASATLPAVLKTDVASTSVLLKAQALLASGKTRPAAVQEGLDLLKKLRNNYPKTDAAVYSYIAEADYHSARNEIVAAQTLFTSLADDNPDSNYAPFALYEAALNAERRGQDNYYDEAYLLLERLVTTYPKSDLVFYARLKQGDLLRKQNKFGAAQQAYQLLVDNFPEQIQPDVLLAQLALADCHYAQAANDPSHWESAAAICERLQDLPTAPVDLRVEAGFKHGYAQVRRGNPAQAERAWWLAVNTFLLDSGKAAELGAKGRYWMSRVLLELGDLYEKEAKLEPARRAYELLLQQKLPGETLAQQRLARFKAGKGGGETQPE
jgi:tetratricopeptide (TPR) repeat protein